MTDPFQTLRNRQADLADLLNQRPRTDPIGVGLFQVFNAGSIPTGGGKYYATHPVDPGGTESEGSTPTLTAGTANVPVLVLDQTAAVGDYLIARQIGGRWVAEARGGTGGGGGPTGGSPTCLCGLIPATLTITPDVVCGYTAGTVTWKATPPDCAGVYGPLGFYGDSTFTITTGSGTQTCRWYFDCDSRGYYYVGYIVVYDTSPVWSGFAYFSGGLWNWFLDGTTNICTPFSLTNAQIKTISGCNATVTG